MTIIGDEDRENASLMTLSKCVFNSLEKNKKEEKRGLKIHLKYIRDTQVLSITYIHVKRKKNKKMHNLDFFHCLPPAIENVVRTLVEHNTSSQDQWIGI